MRHRHSRLHVVTTDTDLPEAIPQVGVLTLKPETRAAVMKLSRHDRKRLMTILTALRDTINSDQQLAAKLRGEIQLILASVSNNQTRTATDTPTR